MAVVVIEQARRRVVGDVEIEASILVVIEPQDAEPVIAVRVDAEFFGDVGERAVAIVVVETVARAFNPRGPQLTGMPRYWQNTLLPNSGRWFMSTST